LVANLACSRARKQLLTIGGQSYKAHPVEIN
jgi:hypothetical protein